MQEEVENILAYENKPENVSSVSPSFIPWMSPSCRGEVTRAVPLLQAEAKVNWGADGIWQ